VLVTDIAVSITHNPAQNIERGFAFTLSVFLVEQIAELCSIIMVIIKL
jgi:hypothetical protein